VTHELTRRVRDPLHGLIRFDGVDPIDCIAWQLIDTIGFQRLRRIKQLGFSEFVFPGATHTRFAHSIGVFHTARNLIRIIDRENPGQRDDRRAAVAVLAALLHDVGHGPFSHAFELAQKARGLKKNHESWSAEIILSPEGGIREVLDNSIYGNKIAEEIAELLTTEIPQDIYHAVVSSSFDADRLDYLRRDKMMSGSGAGSIDFDWLLDNVRVAKVDLSADDDAEGGSPTPIFALGPKALQAAEAFLIARYHLYDQVYLHKTTRGFEIALRECLIAAAEIISKGNWAKLGLTDTNPLVVFLQENTPTVSQYLKLDDFVIWGCLTQFSMSK
jgi:HD superfamily phosphohydrolase